MKIIYSDNIPTDMSSEHLWLDGLPNDSELLERICERLNQPLHLFSGGQYYRPVSDDHQLYKWEP